MPLPLQDVRILAVEQFGAGPWGSLQLSDLGAEVVKIEDPIHGGDVGRYVPPFQEGEDSLFFETFNRDKLSVSLDLRTASGRAVFEDLVRHADAVYSNLRGDQPARLRLRYEDLKAVNPAIVCCSLSGFGTTGPRRAEPGYDYVMQGLAGWMSLTGQPTDPPTKSGLSLVDFSGGYVAALALLAGLWQARRDGTGCDCDISLFETALAELTYLGTWVASRDFTPQRVPDSGHQSIVPFQNFETTDGWIVVACPKEKFWLSLCRALGRDDLAADERYRDFASRRVHREELVAELHAVFRTSTSEHWLHSLHEHGVPCAPINDVAAALADPQATARQVVVEIEHPRLGIVRQVDSPLRVGEAPRRHTRAAFRGEHTRAVLERMCGYDEDRLSALTAAGAFGDTPPADEEVDRSVAVEK